MLNALKRNLSKQLTEREYPVCRYQVDLISIQDKYQVHCHYFLDMYMIQYYALIFLIIILILISKLSALWLTC